jgi:uncharacterized protein (UPF0335 family)
MENKKSIDFLSDLSWKGKDREQIIKEMELEDYEQKYLNQAMKELAAEGKYTGYDLDRRILLLIDMHEDEDDFDEDDVVYIR